MENKKNVQESGFRRGVQKFAGGLNVGLDKYIPDAIVLAFILTFIVYIWALVITDATPFDLIRYWGEGFWSFLLFSMQMAVMVAGGYIVSSSPPVTALFRKLAGIPKGAASAITFIFVVSSILGFVNWGLGIIGGAFLSRAIAIRIKRLDFKVGVAACYAGAQVGTLGISASEYPLVNTEGYFLQDVLGLIPMSDTVFHPMNLAPILIMTFIVGPIFCILVTPKDESKIPMIDDHILQRFADQDNAALELQQNRTPKSEMTPAERMNNSPITSWVIGLAGVVYLCWWFGTRGFDLTLNIMNFTLIILGVIFHKTPARLLIAAEEGVRSAFGVLLQFPFYAGIQGMMGASGLMVIVADYFATHSTAASFPFLCYVAGAFLNIFVPSSGGIFMISGPALGPAALALGVPANVYVMSFTIGEVLSNMIQPFWAIPMLAIAGLKMKDIMGYCIIFFILSTIVFLGTWAIIL